MHISPAEPTLRVEISAQPNDTTCGPTCLHAVYRFFHDTVPLDTLIAEVPAFAEGGTLGVHLGCHALRRGYPVTLYSYNLRVWDPTWFNLSATELEEKLKARAAEQPGGRKRRDAVTAYRQFLKLGGAIKFADLTGSLIRHYLVQGFPILAGVSATWLYQGSREIPETNRDDDIRGDPVGHFVVLAGYDRERRAVNIADPYAKNPLARHYYSVSLERLSTALLLGVLTYDANLLIIKPRP